MKQAYLWTLALGVALSLCGCDSYLDRLPDNRVEVDTAEDIRKLLVNAYPTASPAILCEFSSDNTDDIGAENPYFSDFSREVTYWQDPLEYGDNDGLAAIWQAHYKAIAHANLALEHIARIGERKDTKPLKAEALLARAWGHFVLVNIFAPHYNTQTSAQDLGLPYLDASERELNPQYTRSSVAEVYRRIAQDIEEALPLLDDNSYRKPKYHFNRRAAYAFAARFYLYYEQWERALACANEVLGNTQPVSSELLRDWTAFRTLAADNDSQAKEYSRVDAPSNLMLQTVKSSAYRVLNLGSNLLRFSHSKRNATEETVACSSLWGKSYDAYKFRLIVADRSDLYNRVSFPKYPYFSSSSSSTVAVPFTTEETLLVRAEALALLNRYDEAMLDVNALSNAVLNATNTTGGKTTFTLSEVEGFYGSLAYASSEACTPKKRLNPKFAISAGTQESLLHYILQWRRIITLHEGLRWFDVRRYGIVVHRYQHDRTNKHISTIEATLGSEDPRRAIQLPIEVRSSGMQANPR